jgi:hypothetical protein
MGLIIYDDYSALFIYSGLAITHRQPVSHELAHCTELDQEADLKLFRRAGKTILRIRK